MGQTDPHSDSEWALGAPLADWEREAGMTEEDLKADEATCMNPEPHKAHRWTFSAGPPGYVDCPGWGAEPDEDTKNWEDLTPEQKRDRILVEGAMYEAEGTKHMPVTWPAQWLEVFPGRDLLDFPKGEE